VKELLAISNAAEENDERRCIMCDRLYNVGNEFLVTKLGHIVCIGECINRYRCLVRGIYLHEKYNLDTRYDRLLELWGNKQKRDITTERESIQERYIKFIPVIEDILSPSYDEGKRKEPITPNFLCDVCNQPVRGGDEYGAGWCDRHGLVAVYKIKENTAVMK
jgi:hypothetical protein